MNAATINQYRRMDVHGELCAPDMFGRVSMDWEQVWQQAPAELRRQSISMEFDYDTLGDALVFPADNMATPAEQEKPAAAYRQWVVEFFS